MGRANSRRRKGSDHHHLPKVGSAPELEHDGQRERAAVMDVMGLGNLGPGAKAALFWVGVLIMAVAIIALLILLI
jgi:hypothetical protein